MKIRCVCCHGTAEVTGTHEFKALRDCNNQTVLERGAGEGVRVRARNYDLIRLWDEDRKKYVPLTA